MHEKNLSGFQDLYCLQFTFTESIVNEVVSVQFRRSVMSISIVSPSICHGPSSESYDSSSSQEWMEELDHKERCRR